MIKTNIKMMAIYLFGEKNTRIIHNLFRYALSLPLKLSHFPMRYISTNRYKSTKLALGERRGYKFPAQWIGMDWEDSDFNINFKHKDKLPFEDCSMDVIYTAHMLEHIGYDSGEHLIEETFRLLKPGGWIRIEVPDVQIFIEKYLSDDKVFLEHFSSHHKDIVKRFSLRETRIVEKHCAVLDCISHFYPLLKEKGALHNTHVAIPVYIEKDIFDQKLASSSTKEFIEWAVNFQTGEQLDTGGHQCGYNFEIMKEILFSKGFNNINKMSFGKTLIPNFSLNDKKRKGVDSVQEKEHRQFFSLYVEAQKPINIRVNNG